MDLFTAAHHRALFCDALLVDTTRALRIVRVTTDAAADGIAEAVLDRFVLMGRSLHDVRDTTFCVFAARDNDGWSFGLTEPLRAGVLDALRDTLDAFGPVESNAPSRADASGLHAWLAFRGGVVTLLDTPTMRGHLRLASRHGLRIAAAVGVHALDPDVFVGDVPAERYIDEAETTLDLDALDTMPPDEIARLFPSPRPESESS